MFKRKGDVEKEMQRTKDRLYNEIEAYRKEIGDIYFDREKCRAEEKGNTFNPLNCKWKVYAFEFAGVVCCNRLFQSDDDEDKVEHGVCEFLRLLNKNDETDVYAVIARTTDRMLKMVIFIAEEFDELDNTRNLRARIQWAWDTYLGSECWINYQQPLLLTDNDYTTRTECGAYQYREYALLVEDAARTKHCTCVKFFSPKGYDKHYDIKTDIMLTNITDDIINDNKKKHEKE